MRLAECLLEFERGSNIAIIHGNEQRIEKWILRVEGLRCVHFGSSVLLPLRCSSWCKNSKLHRKKAQIIVGESTCYAKFFCRLVISWVKAIMIALFGFRYVLPESTDTRKISMNLIVRFINHNLKIHFLSVQSLHGEILGIPEMTIWRSSFGSCG